MQDSPIGRQAAVDSGRLTHDQIPPDLTSGAVTACNVLAESAEREMWLRRVLDAERLGYDRGHKTGFAAGYGQSEADLAASWRTLAEPITHPERGTARRIQAALAGERRDAAAHERSFVIRAYAILDADRTDVQRAAVLSYPPLPGRPR